MPQVVNGIGTWYYGRERVHRVKGACEFCGHVGELASYDTTLYFVVFFVPVFPLKRKRVLEECPRCQRHRVADLKKWEEGKQRDITAVLERLQQNPDDREAARDALAVAGSYQDQELFEKLVPLTADHAGDAEIQAQLAAGYGYFGRRREAIEAYKKSLLAEDNPKVRQLL